jgi:hypothetical protein
MPRDHHYNARDVETAMQRLGRLTGRRAIAIREGAYYSIQHPDLEGSHYGAFTTCLVIHAFCDGWKAKARRDAPPGQIEEGSHLV